MGVRCGLHNHIVAGTTLLDEIERDALDDSVPIATALRKCVALGGDSGSEALRDWAVRELEGYQGDIDVPSYRTVPAQLQIDGATYSGLINGQPIPRSTLPDFVQESIREEVTFREGAGTVEALVRNA